MIHINLLPVKEAQRALGRRNQLSLGLLSVTVALLVMVIPYVLQGRTLSHLESESAQLRIEIKGFNEQVKEVKDLGKRKAELQAKLKIIDDLKQKRVGPVRILEDLGSAAPEKLWLVGFDDVAGQATITGLALDNQTIAGFMRQLQGSNYFYDVDLVETSQSEPLRNSATGESGMIFKKFIIKAHLDYLGTGGKGQAPPPGTAKTGA